MTSSWHSILPDVGVLSLSGKDAAKLLQGQATCDILGLPPGQTTLGAFCTAKGRAYALFRALRTEDRVFLLLSVELLETVRHRLSRYVMRSDVKIEDVSSDWAVIGLFGPYSDAALHALGLPSLVQDNEAEGQSGLVASFYAIRIPDPESPRILVLADAAKAGGISRFMESHGLERVEATRWTLEDIRAGIPSITTATVEEFVPQMLNLDVLNGISFNKGCYTGQEIVARTHYLGQLKRRMFRLEGAGSPAPLPGEAIFRQGEETQVGGMVVSAAMTPEGGFELLAVLNRATAEEAGVQFKSTSGQALSVSALPYALPDPA